MDKYRHVIKAIFETPWAIRPETLALIVDLARFRASGGRLAEEEIAERLAAVDNGPRTGGRRRGTVAVLPLYGVIGPRADMFRDSSGGTSLDTLSAQFRAALADNDVDAIIFDVDSPGGLTDGVEEFATEVREARGRKPIVASANYMAASAAYWIASQADEIAVTPSGSVGSIGILTAHQDLSQLYEREGIKTTLITHGDYKAEANEFEPLSDDARANIQEQVSTLGGMFEASVAKGRRVSVDTVRTGFGQGRMLMAKKALGAGMADRIETLDQTIARVARGVIAAPAGQRAAYIINGTTAGAQTDELELELVEGEPIDGFRTYQPALATGPFSSRLTAVTAEAAELATIALGRAQRRTDRKSPLSAAHLTELEELRSSLLATAGSIGEILEPAAAPRASTVNRHALELMRMAYERGYRIPETTGGTTTQDGQS